jgi:hypothetical protein
MIPNIREVVVTPRTARIVRAVLNARRVRAIFKELRSELDARTLHSDVQQHDPTSGVSWSLWVGRFTKSVPFLLGDRFQETRYSFLLLLEHAGFVAVVGSGIGDIADSVADEKVSYQTLLALRSEADAEIESLSTRSLRAARVGVMRSTQAGRHLERALPRVGANQAAPFQIAVRKEDQAWRISPSSGRVALSGGRAKVPELCSWFASTCDELTQAGEPSDFMKAFAHPVALIDLPHQVLPTALQLDSTVIDDLIDGDGVLRRGDADMTHVSIKAAADCIRQLWFVQHPRTAEDRDSGTWRLTVDGTEVGRLIVRATKISLASDYLNEIQVTHASGATETLGHLFNTGDQPLRLTFSDPSYAYAGGQLFRDHRLLGSRGGLIEVLRGGLPHGADVEKTHSAVAFEPESLFGFVVDHASADDEFLICDDLGAEWADFIGVCPARHQVSFYHCKGGTVDVGASGLHEVVAQAAKNLGYLTASAAELESRQTKWQSRWNNTNVPRLQRGGSVAAFTAAFIEAVGSPQAIRRVILLTSSLSRSAVVQAFHELDTNAHDHAAVHVLWLLSVFVDQCRTVNAVPAIVCRP